MSNFLTRALIESDSNYVIERSLRFNAASSQYLTRTFAGDGVKATHSFIVKRGKLGVQQFLFGWSNFSTISYGIAFTASDALTFANVTGGAINLQLVTTRLFRDCSAHYHIVVQHDTAQATASDRVKIFVNGERITSFSTATYPAQNAVLEFGTSRAWSIGATAGSADFFDGYDSEHRVVLGQALDASSFGEINTVTGQWVAKKYTGAYGTNGFYLDFKDGTSTTTLGHDKSGNNNHWTLTNFTRSAGVNDCWMLDVPAGNGSASAVQPSGNYCVMNPLDSGTGFAFSKGNLAATIGGTWNTCRGSIGITSGQWYWEVQYNATAGLFGIAGPVTNLSTNLGTGSTDYGYQSNGTKWNNNSNVAYGSAFAVNVVVGVAFDADARTITFYNANVSQGVAYSSIPAGVFFPAFAVFGGVMEVNMGQRSFAYTPPTGFKALCAANLPIPAIKKPSDHFNVQLSTGANIKTDAEALFTNELEWIKDRANANNHQLIDSVRGSNAVLQSNTTAAETTYTAPSGSSVGWVWRASDSAAVTNNNGSISSQVLANVAAGFSIVTYTGTGANATVGHGLGIAPKMVILKSRSASGSDWMVYHDSLGNTLRLKLNETTPQTAEANAWNNTTPSSTVFSIGSNVNLNTSSSLNVAYCFAEIAGYSKFGSYTGNGSAEGPFVHTGFRPKYVLIKRTDSIGNWRNHDTSRDTYNVAQASLYPNLSNAEGTGSNEYWDLLSNGFKLRTADSEQNASGGTYIYMAFAETPFNYANAR